jgi:pyridoxine 4-dehydrogenase
VVNYRRQPSVESLAEHFGALAELCDAGLIRHLGISGVELYHLAEAQTIAPVVCVQNAYSIVDRRPESGELLRACGEQGIAFVPFFAVAGTGRHGGPPADEPEQITAIAREHGATPAQIRLAWSLQQGPHVLAIPGTGNPDHLLENVAAGAIRLSDDELASLARISC